MLVAAALLLSGCHKKATNAATGIVSTVKTDGAGFYSFAELAVGDYNLEVQQTGFKTYHKTAIHIDANSAVRADVKLEIGQITEEVTVTSAAVQVETESTQNGDVISGAKMTTLPLNGRAFTDLLALQPGVIPNSFAVPVQKQFGGLTDRNVSGDLNPGNQSINGQRQSANGFMVNGSNVEEGKNNGAGVVPNLDSIAEFRIITNNFDAEYGNYSGGQINVVTKSGTNAIHGSAFEFLRNTALDARNFFAPQIDNFKQNQFGGTVGGPIRHDKVFFFGDYQGTRTIRGQVLNNNVPSLADRPDTNGGTADVSDIVMKLTGVSTVTGANWAAILNQRLGRSDIMPGTPYFFTSTGGPCTAAPTCVFPNFTIPASAINPVALKLLPFIPKPNGADSAGNANFASASENLRNRDDKFGVRLDGNTRYGMLSAYYAFDDYLRNDPYPNNTLLGGPVSAAGFNSLTPGRAQLLTLADAKTFGSSAVNEFRISFVRIAGSYFKPQGGLGPSLSSLGFTPAMGTGMTFNGGIAPVDPRLQGVPQVLLAQQGAGLSIGLPQDTQNAYNNTYQVLDNFSKVIGRHSLKFGGQFHYDQINERNFFGENGAFTFAGGETGSDFVDFLLGAPDNKCSTRARNMPACSSRTAGARRRTLL
jgi:hypothetical protein